MKLPQASRHIGVLVLVVAMQACASSALNGPSSSRRSRPNTNADPWAGTRSERAEPLTAEAPNCGADRPRMSRAAAQLLSVAQDTNRSRKERAEAIDALAQLHEPAVVRDLLEMFPGDWDVVTVAIINIAVELGDSRALSRLREAATQSINIPGFIRGMLQRAIKKLESRLVGVRVA